VERWGKVKHFEVFFVCPKPPIPPIGKNGRFTSPHLTSPPLLHLVVKYLKNTGDIKLKQNNLKYIFIKELKRKRLSFSSI